jgi:hypothetical protein
LTTCTPALRSSVPTPPVSLATTPSFHFWVWSSAMVGCCTRMPSGEPLANFFVLPNSSAAWISAFEGMQPMLRQVPPRRSPSTSTVAMPSWPARMAAT